MIPIMPAFSYLGGTPSEERLLWCNANLHKGVRKGMSGCLLMEDSTEFVMIRANEAHGIFVEIIREKEASR